MSEGSKPAHIGPNATGCNSIVEIKESCPTCLSYETIEWIGTGGTWMEALNWDKGRVPTRCDYVYILNGACVKIPDGSEGECFLIYIEEGAELQVQSGATFEVYGEN